MGVRKRVWGSGVGSQLLQTFEHWALASGLKRLELTVHASNTRAIRLYERAGFLLEGRKSDAIIVNDVPVDECVMGKALA
jgi:RimJ/RimL family protein N-acetyltransferase